MNEENKVELKQKETANSARVGIISAGRFYEFVPRNFKDIEKGVADVQITEINLDMLELIGVERGSWYYSKDNFILACREVMGRVADAFNADVVAYGSLGSRTTASALLYDNEGRLCGSVSYDQLVHAYRFKERK
jgi:hypothetical protein